MLLLIHGEDTFQSGLKLQELRKGGKVRVYHFADVELADFFEKLSMSSLFNEAEVVLARNFLIGAKRKNYQKELLAFFSKHSHEETVIFYEDQTVKSGVFFSFFQNNGEIFTYPKLKKAGVKKIVTELLKVDGFSLEAGVVDVLITYLGEDLWSINREIEKLKLLTYESKEITVSDIKGLTTVSAEGNIFSFVDALGSRLGKESLQQMLLLMKKGESPFKVFSMVQRQYRLLLQAKDLLNRQVSGREISEKLHVAPFIGEKLLQQSRKYTFEELSVLYSRLLTIDTSIKLGEDPQLQLQLFVEEVCGKG